MKRLNILILTLLGRGHVYPVLPLCYELSTRQHRVTYVTSEHFAPAVRGAGAEALIIENASPGSEFKKWWNSLANAPFDSPDWFALPDEWIRRLRIDTAHLYERVSRFFNSEHPDLVLYDQYYYPGYVIARRLECPRIRISAHFANYNSFLMRRNGVCMNSESTLEFAKRLSRFFSDEGVETSGRIWIPEDFNIHFVPGEFQYHRESFNERYCFVGCSMNRQFPRKWTDRGDPSPIILISQFSGIHGAHGEVPGYVRLFIEALANSECHCILLSEHEKFPVGELPDNFEVCPGASPLEILPRSALFVCHGGMGSTLESICNGIPVLAIPSHPGADEVAYRTAELGLGRRILKQEVSRENIREIVSRMIWDKCLKERVNKMRDMFGRSVGTGGAVDGIERFVETL